MRKIRVTTQHFGILCSLGLLFVLVVSVAHAGVTGSISGTVKDPSGGVIPGATVTALNTGTGISQSVDTDSVGFYVFPALPVGTYDISIKHAGFKEYRQTGLALDATVALRIDATLEVGAVAQEVTVQSSTVHVDTTSTQMGEIIGGMKMTTLPLNGRSYTDLLALQPGVVAVSAGTYSSLSVSGGLNPGNLSVSGQRESSNGFVVNGGNVQEPTSMGTSIIPDLDSIAEFRIITNNGEAEYGNYSGGQVHVVTKSGTNQFHGSGFEFLRNSKMDARNFYDSDRGKLRQNQFGGTFGGPIRHDKVFFFGDYQGWRRTIGVSTGRVLVPSAAERNGSFDPMAFTCGDATDAQGHTIYDQGNQTNALPGPCGVGGAYWAGVLKNALGYPVTNGESYGFNVQVTRPYIDPQNPALGVLVPCTTSAQCVFANGQIPQAAWSTPSKNMLQYIPDPNSGPYFTSSAYPATLRDDKWSTRIDANTTRLGMISGYYFWDDYKSVDPYSSASVPGFSTGSVGRSQQINISDTKNFGPTSINELRVNYVRTAFGDSIPLQGLGASVSSQGFTGIVPGGPEGVVPFGTNSFSIGVNPYYGTGTNNTYQILDNFSKVKGTHTMKFGANFHYDQVYQYGFGARIGDFGFDGTETGNDFADFALGAPAWYNQGMQLPMYTRGRYFGVYGQDTWRFRSNLTLNYGLRWEFSTPWWEVHNQIETLIPGVQSKVFPGAPEGWLFPGDPGVPSTLAPTRYNNFAPRLGLAYSPEASGGFWRKLLGGPGQTSIRAGFGVYFTAFEDVTSFNEVGDAPYGYWWASGPPPLYATPFVDRATGNDHGQRFPAPLPPLNVSPSHPDNSIDWSVLTPINSSPGFFHENRLPYTEEYSFSFQRQFGPNTMLSLAYVGAQGHRLLSDLESNPANPALCLSLSDASQVMPDTAVCGPGGEDTIYYPITGGTVYGTRTVFPFGIASNGYFATMGNSNFNSLQTSLRHTGGRTEFLIGYTWSKSLDNASSWGGGGGGQINVVNHSLSKAFSNFDMAHNFIASYTYELPFDKLVSGKRPRLSRGWIISGTTRFATGLAIRIRENDDNSLLGTRSTGPTGQGVDVPDFHPGALHITDPRKYDYNTGANPYFDNSIGTGARWDYEPLGKLGTASRAFFHGPGLNNWNLAIHKDLRITESKTLQFRGEFFNAFNHAQFYNPTGNVLSGNFGVVTDARDPRIGQVAMKFIF